MNGGAARNAGLVDEAIAAVFEQVSAAERRLLNQFVERQTK